MTSASQLRPRNGTGRRLDGARRGLAAVEFALVAPVLVAILIGALDYTRAVRTSLIVSNAARVGAEYGAAHRFTPETRAAWEAAVRAAVLAELSSSAEFDADQATIDVTTTTDSLGGLVVVVRAGRPSRTIFDGASIDVVSETALPQYR